MLAAVRPSFRSGGLRSRVNTALATACIPPFGWMKTAGCPQDFKSETEELMTDEENRVFLESGGTIFPHRLRDYDDMISPMLDAPLEEALQ